MLQAMFSGVSGLLAHQIRMNVIGNNISNVNTIGYKSGRVTFQDQLSQTLRSATGPAPSKGIGGQNAAQVGLGVTIGAVDTFQTQGNLQTTGKPTDLAIQGGGFFLVSTGTSILYTRDGTFDLDSSGSLVNPSTGQRLLGYPVTAAGAIDTGAPINASSTIQIPIGTLTDAKQTDNIGFLGNLDANSAIYSTKVDYTGNLDSTVTPGTSVPTAQTTTVYDALGNAHTVQTIFSNPVDAPAGAGVPAGATRSWDVVIKVDNNQVYDSTAGKSKLYRVGGAWQFADTGTGATLGSSIAMDGAAGSNHGPQIPGTNGATAFSINLNYGVLTAAGAASTVTGAGDGQTGNNPVWGTSLRVFDSLGVPHLLSFKYTRVPLGVGGPVGATARWDWTASENGTVLASNATGTNTPLYFGTTGRLVGGGSQKVTVTPVNGSISPFTVNIDNNKLVQLASDPSVTGGSQDGFPVGTLQSFAVSPDGVVTGVFSSGQSRPLGQIAMASFGNPAGLEKAGGNLFRESGNSGIAQIGQPNQGGRGKITPGFLEMSNVDLSTEFTNMIVTERGFQANTRIITVVDSLLQEVINLKR